VVGVKVREWIGLGVAISLGLAVVLVFGGWLIGERVSWRLSASSLSIVEPCVNRLLTPGPGYDITAGSSSTSYCAESNAGFERIAGQELTLDAVQDALVSYIQNSGIEGLEVVNVMLFENHYYCVIAEQETGIGAMELLVDKWSGTVTPAKGPNVVWNTKYGPHLRDKLMMDRSNVLSPQILTGEALTMTQMWLTNHQPGLRVGTLVVPFYGYYTISVVDDDGVVGLLSVHDTTGQVWYQTWHGAYIASEPGLGNP
jgi:hypothetical protein